MRAPVLPGGTIGVFGGGQLGRMMALAARALGYHIHVFSPEPDAPAVGPADLVVVADYADLDAVRAFARAVDVITVEFENIPLPTLEAAAAECSLRPGVAAIAIAQHRWHEKQFLQRCGIPVAPCAPVAEAGDLAAALAQVGTPAILKSATLGYDGRGQVAIDTPDAAAAALMQLGAAPAILERRLMLRCELSVVAARGADGAVALYGPLQNSHSGGILDLSFAPAAVESTLCRQALEMSRTIVEQLALIGVLCVEFFVTTDDRLLVNELAPRPHNSGHLTIEAAVVSQFEQQVRAVCGLPLGDTRLMLPAAMANLLGDLWADGEPDWAAACAMPQVALHLYGKRAVRPGRKMGHLTAVAAGTEEAIDRVLAARRAVSHTSRISGE